uniref:Uncharacterized protein n=1 Tax=Arundo donax TaxID=35708 RepID=A0A0A9B258_ARUDO
MVGGPTCQSKQWNSCSPSGVLHYRPLKTLLVPK